MERVKSELIIAGKLLDRLSELSGDELVGASKIFSSFLEALEGETNLAYNVSGMKDFETASIRVREAADRVSFSQYEEAMRSISEAISHVTSSGQWAMETLKNHSLL